MNEILGIITALIFIAIPLWCGVVFILCNDKTRKNKLIIASILMIIWFILAYHADKASGGKMFAKRVYIVN